MPVFRVKAPDGNTYRVEAPEGTTEEQAIERVRSQYENPTPKNDLAATLAQIDAMPAGGTSDKYNPEGSTTSYLGQQVKKGVAAALGFPVDSMQNVVNLLPETVRLGLMAAGRYDLANQVPTLKGQPVGGSGTFERLFLTNNDIKPTSPGAEVAGRYMRDLSAAAVPGAGIASRAASPTLSLGTQGILSLLASTGGEAARRVVPEPYQETADLTGTLLGGIAAPAMIANRIDTVNNLRNATTPNKINAMADRYVNRGITEDVRNYPGAPQNLDEALKLEQQIPGLQLRIGQATNVPSLLDMEQRVATAGPTQFNTRSLQDAAQQAAIRAEAERRLPLLAGKNDIAQQLAATKEQRLNLASLLPETEADEIGRVLRDTRTSLKGRYDQIAATKFEAPVAEAERLDVKLDPSRLLEKAVELQQNPILQFDATNSPAVLRRIFDASTKTAQEARGPTLVDSRGQPYVNSKDRPIPLTFADLKGMREAVNQDIAREAGSATPNARQRLRALVEIRGEIDRTAQQAPESVRKLWSDATNWYRDVYAPKFLRGINLRQGLKDITGEMKIPDEKLASKYFQPMGATPMERFMNLYGDNPQAMQAMESHVLDTYRRNVVKDGVIDPQKHEVFIRNYGPALKKLPETADNFKSLSSASKMLAEREDQLASAQKILSQGQLEALKYEPLPNSGLDPKKLNAYLTKNGDTFADSIGEVYGKQVAQEHLANLKEIAKAAEVADRGSLADAAKPNQALSPLSLQKSVGFTGRTVFNMMRAVVAGRTSVEDMAYTLGAQSASHRIGQALIAAEERALSDPETAKLIVQAIKQPVTSQQGQLTLRNILSKGGMYFIGGNKYGEFAKLRAAPTAIQATQQGKEE